MTIFQKLQKIKESKCLYNICFRNAGIGLQFFDELRMAKPILELAKKYGFYKVINLANWRECLVIDRYYPTLKEAIEAEYKKLKLE